MAKQDKRTKELQTTVAELAPAAEALGERQWVVSLPGNPERVVTAAEHSAAVAAYRREMGIVATEHEFKVGAGG